MIMAQEDGFTVQEGITAQEHLKCSRPNDEVLMAQGWIMTQEHLKILMKYDESRMKSKDITRTTRKGSVSIIFRREWRVFG